MKPIALSFVDILNRSEALRSLLEKANRLAKLEQILFKQLDPSLASHCRLTNIRDNVLIITADTPGFGHKLRYLAPQILSFVRQNPQWSGIKSIETRVIPESDSPHSSVTQSILPLPSLSAESAEQIHTTALTLSAPALSEALLKLAGSKTIP